jgi:hypothetical protein
MEVPAGWGPRAASGSTVAVDWRAAAPPEDPAWLSMNAARAATSD